ncbi:hypothetical protein ACWEQL_24160 [Kitasatospora sp. NPDC004240]
MPVKPPESQDVPSGFDPGQETPPLRSGVWGDSGVGPGVIGSSGQPAPDGPQDAVEGGAGVLGLSVAEGGTGVRGLAARGSGVHGQGGGAHPGVTGTAVDGPGVAGVSEHGTGVTGVAGGTDPGVAGRSAQGAGVTGVAGGTGPGVAGRSAQGAGVTGVAGGTGPGVAGTSTTGSGVTGQSVQGVGVGARSQSGIAMAATSGSGAAVRAVSSSGTAVSARSGRLPTPFDADGLGDPGGIRPTGNPPASPSPAIEGLGVGGAGVVATSFGTVGVIASGPVGIVATGRILAGRFQGSVHVTGALIKGGGGFRIDHPLDPENRFLAHSFVESPERKNVYDGTVTLDAGGRATVELPDWFEALNEDFRYQLTALGAPAPDLHVSREIGGRSFQIAGGGPGQRVSWQVTGVRADVWAKGNPLEIEEEKPPAERGFLLHPAERGEPPERGLAAAPGAVNVTPRTTSRR